jgi:hypothetical protein
MAAIPIAFKNELFDKQNFASSDVSFSVKKPEELDIPMQESNGFNGVKASPTSPETSLTTVKR